MNLNQLFEHAKQQAVKAFDEFGEITPTWILETADGMTVPLVIPPAAMSDKDRLAQTLAVVFNDGKVVRYCSMLEAWAIRGKDKKKMEDILENLDETPIRKHPDRIEVVYLMAEDKYHMRSGHFNIIRPANGKAYLSEFHEDDAGRAEGRFCNLLTNGTGIH